MDIIPVILCGGAGTRLWPLSRELYPKQLLSLVGENSLLQDTANRIIAIEGIQEPVLVCNEEHRFLVAEQLREMDVVPETIILEPEGRNTAPAVALAALQSLATRQGEDSILVVLPSDHVISNHQAFGAALGVSLDLAEAGHLVTFGITPAGPETGYGYIRAGNAIGGGYVVDEFVEKPDLPVAESYVRDGGYYWNSGMFVFRASRYLEELQDQRPAIHKAVDAAYLNRQKDEYFTRPESRTFLCCPSDSVDYAVMEGTGSAVMVALDAGWSDIGSWDALWKISNKDENGNTLIGDVIVEDVEGSYIRSEHKLVSVVGLQDLVVVETADAVLVAHQKRSQEVRKVVESLQSSEREEQITHRKVYRPWGHYENLDSGHRFQVKRICVKPGASLSLQKHHHRAEHWTVVCGTARVTRDEEIFEISENESTFIPLGAKHRLENPGRVPLEIIEVQSGHYLGEDDIVRFEDSYGRSHSDDMAETRKLK